MKATEPNSSVTTAYRRKEVIGDAVLYLADSAEWLSGVPDCFRIDSLITDPPYGVGFTGKVAVQRGGETKKADGGYASFEDTPENIDRVVVPIIRAAINISQRAAVTPGTRNFFKYPDPADIGCFFSAAGTGVGRWGFTCSQPILYYGKDPYLERGLGARANSLGQTYPNDANTVGHPCAKPLPQMMWLVNRASADGETVLDPFMGSGTTGVACANLGRRFIGIEIEPRYFDIACERIAAAYAQGRLFA